MLINNQVKYLKILGKENTKVIPRIIFDDLIIKFFNEIYLSVKKLNEARIYPDLYTFSFWCREKNLKKISTQFKKKEVRIGRGIVYHIAPSNVPMNFAYSFAFGMLSGNYNIVRLPSKNFYQIRILCDVIKKICIRSKYKQILSSFLFIRYERSLETSNYFSSKADARLIWGGDKTIDEFKKYKTQPRCVDLNFANRFSFSIIKPSSLKKITKKNYLNFLKNFYNDCYLMDQKGCSSPKLILWLVNKETKNIDRIIIEKFWKDFQSYVSYNYRDDLSIANKKISLLLNDILKSNINYTANYKKFNVVRLKIKNLSNNFETLNNSFGTFAEKNITDLEDLKKIVTKKFQTLTYFGISEKEVLKIIIKNGIPGIDRMVKIGRANDIDVIWDGFDIINSLSRIIIN